MYILQKIKENSTRNANLTAMISGYESITYGELWKMSEALAVYLDNNFQDDKAIVVYGHKSPFMLVSFLACLKSGHAYIPVDISIPDSRVFDIIESSGTDVVLAIESITYNCNVINKENLVNIIEKYMGEKSFEDRWVKGDDLFYILFTSGSTGKPKGVQITYNCINKFLDWALKLGNTNKTGKIFINQAPFSFDLSVYELYMSLASAGTLFCLPKELLNNMKLLFDALAHSKANIWVSTPSFVDMCLADKSFCSNLLPNLEMFLFCGETLQNSTVSKLHKQFPGAMVINTYGPTESTVAVTDVVITREINESVSPLPVGKPKNGSHIYIVDTNHKILNENEKGEIVIAGDTVSTGYFKNEELTKIAFDCINNERCYYTGDAGYLKDNMLYYCGRIDLQVKLNGFRIELQDIENNMMKLSYIKNAVVIPILKNEKVSQLTCFVVLNNKVAESDFAATMIIKNDLKGKLPSYMIPKKIVIKTEIPMTANGKVDRKSLKGE